MKNQRYIHNLCRNNLLLLKTEMNAGHGGKSGRDGAIEEIAIDYAFILKITKMRFILENFFITFSNPSLELLSIIINS